MIMADVLAYFLLIVGLYIVFIGYWLMSEALFPALVERCRVKYEKNPVKSTFKGLAAAVPLVLGGFALATRMGNPVAQIAGVGLLILTLMLGLVGSTGLCRQIGRGLGTPPDEAQPWRRVLRGGLVLGVTFILPLVGWFGVLPWTIISGLGALVASRRAAPGAKA